MPARTGPDHRARTVMTSDKVRPHHLERKALLYVRQSSAHQVLHNRESGALQYAMRDRLAALGWSEIEVIDDDLGRSAAGRVQRAGFERMVAQVCLGKVGAVCAREVSRFARNSRDWQQLIEMCRVVDTLLIDEETIFDPLSEGFRHFVTSMTAPIASGGSESPGGPCTHLSGALVSSGNFQHRGLHFCGSCDGGGMINGSFAIAANSGKCAGSLVLAGQRLFGVYRQWFAGARHQT